VSWVFSQIEEKNQQPDQTPPGTTKRESNAALKKKLEREILPSKIVSVRLVRLMHRVHSFLVFEKNLL